MGFRPTARLEDFYDGDVDELVVQINLNKFMKVDNDKERFSLYHNGAVTKKGAKKTDFLEIIKRYNQDMVVMDKLYFGDVSFKSAIRFGDGEVRQMISRLIEYCVYRNEYKLSLAKK